MSGRSTSGAGACVLSWNVNGIRACVRKGFATWLRNAQVEVLGLQEVRALPEEIPVELCREPGWHISLHPAQRRGYSGVGILSRRRPDEVLTSLDEERFDLEGRVQIARFGALWVVNAYFPKGSGRERDNSRVPYKLAFSRRLFDRLEGLRRREKVLVMGDFNTAHRDIDLARPRDNHETSGFLPEEREEMSRWLEAGWADSLRLFESGGGHYSWWSQRFGVRERNVGWRIDYVLTSPALTPMVRRAFLLPDVRGSDHCPAGVEIEEAAFGVTQG